MQRDNGDTINSVWKLENSRTASVLLFYFNFIVISKRTFDVSLFYSLNYLFMCSIYSGVATYALHIFSLLIYLIKLHEFFFFLQAHAGIFFLVQFLCMNFFFGSDTPPPRVSNGPPLNCTRSLFSKCSRYAF